VLAGKRVLITRTAEQSIELAQAIRDLGGETIIFPVIEILPPESWLPFDDALTRLATYQWLVLTSRNGVTAVGERLAALGHTLADYPALRVAVVGTATQAALAALGRSPDVLPPEFRGAALPAVLTPLLRPGDRLLLPRGDLADPALPDALRSLAVQVDELIVYRTARPQADAAPLRAELAAGRVGYVTFTSSTTVENLIHLLGGTDWLKGTAIACIGPETRKAAEAFGLHVEVMADRATSGSLATAIARHHQKA
jgi:uroporphyrinogen III methyltransferase/synthase